MFQQTLTRIFLFSSISMLAACGGGGLTSTGGSVGAGAGDGGGGALFALSDLDGSWTGELLPFLETRGDRNFYLRMLSGNLIDAAEGGGGSWDTGSSTLVVTFTADGFLDLLLNTTESGELHLEGAMNLALDTINGTFTMDEPARDPYSGTFELRLSSGPVTFPGGLVTGAWTGEALNTSDRFRLSSLEVDLDGNLIRAALTKPSSSDVVHHYVAAGNESAFTLADDNIGLFNPVTLTATDGSTLTLNYLLINDASTLMSGPGEDSVLGTGHVELTRPAE